MVVSKKVYLFSLKCSNNCHQTIIIHIFYIIHIKFQTQYTICVKCTRLPIRDISKPYYFVNIANINDRQTYEKIVFES
jgi:hypothetical protein